ncbi:MAG: RpoL/Rpb11 RNA polymerase subunit family protein [Candidatus Aenigmarchaeota archaeon]
MKLVALENGNEKMILEVRGETHTFLNLLRENIWKAGGRQASYMIEHPYLSEPKLTVRAKNPKKIMDNAAQMIIDQTKDFEREFKRVSRR